MLSRQTLAALGAAGLDVAHVEDLARRTVAEDLAGGVDVTSVATVPADLHGTAAFVPRAAGVVAGIGVAMAVLDVVGAVELTATRDGRWVEPGETVLLAMTSMLRFLSLVVRHCLYMTIDFVNLT